MTNVINSLAQQNKDMKVSLAANKQMLDELTNIKVKLQNDLALSDQKYNELLSEKNEKDKQMNLINMENQKLTSELNNFKYQLNQKEQALENIEKKI